MYKSSTAVIVMVLISIGVGSSGALANDLVTPAKRSNTLADAPVRLYPPITPTRVPTASVVDRAALNDLIVSGSYDPLATQPCLCTNLGGVSVVCPDCDKASSVSSCVEHDAACQDAALRGGIREHQSFFCTTQD